MPTKKAKQAQHDYGEKAVAFSVGLAAALVVVIVGAADKWFAAVFVTGGAFLAVIYAFRERWQAAQFWLTIGALLAIHVTLVWVIFAVFLRQRTDIGLLVCIPFIFGESSILYYAVKLIDRRS